MSSTKTYESYQNWDKITKDLVDNAEEEEQKETEQAKKSLGLDGKYAVSEADAKERQKAQEVEKVKAKIDAYQSREQAIMQHLPNLLGPVEQQDNDSGDVKTIRITRDQMDAGKRVLTVSDTSGRKEIVTADSDNKTKQDTIILTQDLSHLESKLGTNTTLAPKKYEHDAENDVVEETKNAENGGGRSIFGLIKVFVQNVHNCRLVIQNCKIISGTVEISHCSNLTLVIQGYQATVATLQVDLCQDINVDFVDAPSGKNTAPAGSKQFLYWGDDKDDRIYHAGVSNMKIRCIRDDSVETEIVADFNKDGATAAGNSTKEEFQFITSVLDSRLITEKVVSTGNQNQPRAMTQRELDQEQILKDKAAQMAIAKAEEMIKLQDKDGNAIQKIQKDDEKKEQEDTSDKQMEKIVQECEDNKAKGNESFGAGEYGQAILLYTLALDKAEELPNKGDGNITSDKEEGQPLFRRDLCYSNRAACFLKLGQHEKALKDSILAQEINPDNIKAIFRHGLSLHAMGNYKEALPVLAKGQKLEPKNKQIKQALQFCEMRLQQEMRQRMS